MFAVAMSPRSINFWSIYGTAQLQGKTHVLSTHVLLMSFLQVESRVLTNALGTRK